ATQDAPAARPTAPQDAGLRLLHHGGHADHCGHRQRRPLRATGRRAGARALDPGRPVRRRAPGHRAGPRHGAEGRRRRADACFQCVPPPGTPLPPLRPARRRARRRGPRRPRESGAIAVLVPGADTTLATFDVRGDKPWSTPGGGARAVHAQALAESPGPELAVVAWLGYDAPRTFSSEVLTGDRADEGGARLRRFLEGVHRVNPSAGVGLLCHSYGSVVCGRAALDGPG